MYSDNQMYRALIDRDESYDGLFFAAIKTTGIFCRPVCTAKKPKRENVEFYTQADEAIKSGYRPCKICNPLSKAGETPEYISNILSSLINDPSIKYRDADLRKMNIEPAKIRRWFLKNHNMTFHSFQRMYRMNSAFKKLQEGESVISAAYDTGFESLSGFSDSFKNIFGVSPSKSKSKNIINIIRLQSPIGAMFAAATNEGLCLLEFSDRRMLEKELIHLSKYFNAFLIQGHNKILDLLQKQLDLYFNRKLKLFSIPISFSGTPFQVKVWYELMRIPYGYTRSYKEQASAIGMPDAVRAVANANGMNKISIVVPCHRVIGNNGTLTGYGGGLWRKKWLLDMEKKG